MPWQASPQPCHEGDSVDNESDPGRRSAEPAVAVSVSEVLVRYATSSDRRDWKLFRTCFTDDCDVDYGTLPNGEAMTWTNVEEMAEWMEASHADMGHTLHRITNQRVERGGSSVTACCYVDVLLMAPDGQLIMNGAGFYDDHLVHTDDGWKIARRRFTSVRMQPGHAT
jgi:3-phenylpropionate/cinnamic acid dioxygenase small subunit